MVSSVNDLLLIILIVLTVLDNHLCKGNDEGNIVPIAYV